MSEDSNTATSGAEPVTEKETFIKCTKKIIAIQGLAIISGGVMHQFFRDTPTDLKPFWEYKLKRAENIDAYFIIKKTS